MDKKNQIFKITNKEKFNQFIKEHPDFEYKKQDVLLRVIAHHTMYVFQGGQGKLQYTWEDPNRYEGTKFTPTMATQFGHNR